MSIISAIIMGLVLGFTEFIPVSSSGHGAIMQNMLGMTEGGNAMLFNAFAHLGVVIALLFFYLEALGRIFKESRLVKQGITYEKTRDGRVHYFAGRKMLGMLVLSSLPMLLIIPISRYIDMLSTKTVFVGFMMVLTGFALFNAGRVEAGNKNEYTATGKDAFIIGICQCVSVLPGLSRAGITMAAGLDRGSSRSFTADYFALLSIPTLIGTAILEFIKSAGGGFTMSALPAYLVGMVAAMVSALAGMSLLRRIARNGKFGGLAYYCWIVGVLTIILTFIF